MVSRQNKLVNSIDVRRLLFIVLAAAIVLFGMLASTQTSQIRQTTTSPTPSTSPTEASQNSPKSTEKTVDGETAMADESTVSKPNSQQSEQSTSLPSSPPYKTNCTYSPIPYKYQFVRSSSSGAYRPGSKGMGETCQMSDGSGSVTQTITQPVDEIDPINVSTPDYDNAVNLCNKILGSSIPSSYLGQCLAIVYQPNAP